MSEKFDLQKSRLILRGKFDQRRPGDLRKLFAKAAEGIQCRIRELEVDVIRHRTFRPLDEDGTHATKILQQAESELDANRRYHVLAVFFLQAMEWFQGEDGLEEKVESWFGEISRNNWGDAGPRTDSDKL